MSIEFSHRNQHTITRPKSRDYTSRISSQIRWVKTFDLLSLFWQLHANHKLLIYAHDIQYNKKMEHHLLGTIIDAKTNIEI